MPIYTDTDFELDGDSFYLCNANADFDWDRQYADGDDYTGWEISNCELVSIRLGGLILTRAQAVDATSEAHIAHIEQIAADTILEQINAGDLMAAE
jgi:hypothetical protein